MLRSIRAARSLKFVGACLGTFVIVFATVLLSERVITASLNSPHLRVESAALNLGIVPADEAIDSKFRLISESSGPIKVVGCHASCGCTNVAEMPLLIPAHGAVDLPFTITSPHDGPFSGTIDLYTDDPRHPVVALSITGQVGRNEATHHALVHGAVAPDQRN